MLRESYVKSYEMLNHVIREYTGKGIANYATDTKLTDMGLGSLDVVQVLMLLEDKLNKEFAKPATMPITINDLVRHVEPYV